MMEELHHSEHIPAWKKQEVQDIKDLIGSYPSFGVVGVGGIPAKQLQAMRRGLKDVAVLKVARNTLIKRAIDESSEDVQKMDEFVGVQTALIFTEQNPFRLFKLLEKGKTPSPIKGGMVAPNDIIVQAGPTGFPPGPILGDLQSAGIPAAIDGGKVVIRETKAVAKAGDVVSQNLAAMLARLEIYPLEVGLDLRAVLEEGSVFTPDVLAIDEEQVFNDFVAAAQQAFNLSVNAVYPTAANITTLIGKAAFDSKNVAINATVYEPDVMGTLLGKAHCNMLAIASAASANNDEAVDEDLKATLDAAAISAPVAVAEESAEEAVEEAAEEEEEGDMAAGLGALFG